MVLAFVKKFDLLGHRYTRTRKCEAGLEQTRELKAQFVCCEMGDDVLK